MSQSHWERLGELLESASAMPARERAGFLDAIAAEDPALKTELEELLAVSEDAGRFFTELAGRAIPALADVLEHEHDVHVGHRYGQYQVIEQIGRGGMGVVYRAEDTRLGRMAALKFLPHFITRDSGARLRLMREARAASMLDHPNICTIFGFEDTPEGETFIAMAYYGGDTLAQRIARGPIPLGEALDIATRLARGLAAAHAHGLSHRDLNPRNVMLPSPGSLKILDFGLAAPVNQPGSSVSAGTPPYMSPEQVRGEPADAASDVWSLGVTLYEIVSGQRPFDAGTIDGTLRAVLEAEPRPLRALDPAVPEPLDRLVRRMLSKDVAYRPRDATEVATELDAIVRRVRGRRLRLVRTAVLALVAVLAAAVAVLATRRPETLPAGVVPEARVVVMPFTSDSGDPDAAFMASGLHRELTRFLGRSRGLAVFSWSTSRPGDDAKELRSMLSSSLGTVAILDGNVRNHSEVSLQLADASTNRVLWSEHIDGYSRYHGKTPYQMALEIAASVGVRPAPPDPRLAEHYPTACDGSAGHCYEAVPVSLDWYSARDAAAARRYQGMRGHLAAITSESESRFIEESFPAAGRGGYWLGGFLDRHAWTWVTGEPFEYTNWTPKNPNDSFGEDGIQLTVVDGVWGWNDIDRIIRSEYWVHGFLVEYEP